MMKALSLKLQEDIFQETEKLTKEFHVPRNTYINRALAFYNKVNRRKSLRSQLALESQLVMESSLIVSREFEEIE